MASRKPKTPVSTVSTAVQTLTRGERLIKFIEKYILVPEGMLVGKPMVLLPEQREYIRAVYDNVGPDGMIATRRGIFSLPRKNGKSGLISAILGGHIIGPEAGKNSQLYSAARSRDQAALVFNYLAKSLRMRPDLEGLVQITDSGKRIQGLAVNTNYRALSADATTAHGLSPALTIHDELGQVIGPTDPLYDALETAGGAHESPLSHIISTQAASDTDLLSTLIDDAIRNPTPETICRLYAADKDDDIFAYETWKKANFALGIFRSEKDMREFAERAKRMPAQEATFRNLYLNMRISRLSLLVAPTLWRDCNGSVNLELFYKYPVSLALDLSASTDLTAAVLSCQDPNTGIIHTLPFIYTPLDTMIERAKTDRAPYPTWVEKGQLIALPGKYVDYGMVARHLAKVTDGMNITVVAFDRWRIKDFQAEAKHADFAQAKDIIWQPVGQGYRDMSPRVEKFEQLLLGGGLAHGGHPLLNMAAANAVVDIDPAGNKKPEKAKSSARIDPLVAQIMSVYALLYPEPLDDSQVKKPVTEKSLFFV
jgi:phage terminase large subunit-like protein